MNRFEVEYEDELYQVEISPHGDSMKTEIAYQGQRTAWVVGEVRDEDTLRLMISSFWDGYHYLRIGNRPAIHDLPAVAVAVPE